MLRYKPQLIALLLVLVMVQGAIADERKKASTGEVIVGNYSCQPNYVRIDFQGTSGVVATDYFQCWGEKGSLSCIEHANTFRTILEERGCAVGIIDEWSNSANFDFVCQGKRKKVINILGDLCSSILQGSQAE